MDKQELHERVTSMEIPKELNAALIGYVPKRYLSQKEACRYMGCSPVTINKHVRENGLKQIIFSDEAWPKYDIKDLEEFMEERKV